MQLTPGRKRRIQGVRRCGLRRTSASALALALVLGVIYLVDSRMTSAEPVALDHIELVDTMPPPPEPAPLPARPPVDPTPRVTVQTTPDGRFGLLCFDGQPRRPLG